MEFAPPWGLADGGLGVFRSESDKQHLLTQNW